MQSILSFSAKKILILKSAPGMNINSGPFWLAPVLDGSLLVFMSNLPSASSVQEHKLPSSTKYKADAKDIILTAS